MLHPQTVAWIASAAVTVAAPALAQEASDADALAREVVELRRAVAVLQARLDAVEAAARPSPPAREPGAAPATSTPEALATASSTVLPNRYTIGDELTGVARADTAAPPNDPQLRGFISIPGTDTMVKLGGFAKVNAIYDFGPAGNPDKLVTATIPIGGGGRPKRQSGRQRDPFQLRRAAVQRLGAAALLSGERLLRRGGQRRLSAAPGPWSGGQHLCRLWL
ncbi:DUF2059 domain-containing protein [Brevundimonas pondensis]|uniref:Porin n=1 Tax=Brevundimonas pondensis TaxID=2774189 RepID=A0ABX7SJ91_9CAUL|nr:hypothetical protein [Brevundimonas pondensis]QTC87083.1 hypothetical protein IFE19_13285 [Brevundimonas pondensis]